MAKELQGYTQQAVISFIDLYSKTKKNFPEAHEVGKKEQFEIADAFVRIGQKYGMTIRSCFERAELANYGVDISGCMTKEVLEFAAGIQLEAPKRNQARPGCNCLLGNDIGAYNTCGHFCRYCYANYDKMTVKANMAMHDPDSPLLIGNLRKDDRITEAKQVSYIDEQLVFPF